MEFIKCLECIISSESSNSNIISFYRHFIIDNLNSIIISNFDKVNTLDFCRIKLVK